MAKTFKLLEPIKIGNVELKNRVYMLPMSTELGENYNVTDRLIDFYTERAKGGTGLVTLGTVMVADFYGTQPQYPSQKGAMGIWSDEFIPGLQKLTSAVRKTAGNLAVS